MGEYRRMIHPSIHHCLSSKACSQSRRKSLLTMRRKQSSSWTIFQPTAQCADTDNTSHFRSNAPCLLIVLLLFKVQRKSPVSATIRKKESGCDWCFAFKICNLGHSSQLGLLFFSSRTELNWTELVKSNLKFRSVR